MTEALQKALSIDVGTTAIKVAVIDARGKCHGLDVEEYSLAMPHPGHVEADPTIYWEGLAKAVRRALEKGRVAPDEIAALALSSQGQTFIPLDGNANPIGPAMVWLDSRATEEARRIRRRFGIFEYYRHTGIPPRSPSLTSCMLLWLRDRQPGLFKEARRFALIQDYISQKACGEAALDESGAVSSGLYDLQEGRWWSELLEWIGLEEKLLPEVVPSASIIGELTTEAAGFLGLQPGTPFVSGAWDQVAAAVGAGNLTPGQITETTGTALAVAATTEGLVFDPKSRLLTTPHAARGKGILISYAPASGIVLKWFREQFCEDGTTYDDLTGMAQDVPVGARGLVFLPHFEGTGSPSFDAAVRGGVVGLGLGHTRADIVRALLESLAFLLRDCLNIVKDLGAEPRRICALGGGARSRLLCQMKADVLGVAVETLTFPEAALQGDAMMALTGIGTFSDLNEAAANMVRHAEVFDPDPKLQGAYEPIYARYVDLLEKLYPRAALTSPGEE